MLWPMEIGGRGGRTIRDIWGDDENGYSTLEVRREVHDAYNKLVDEKCRNMVWAHPGVTSWYKILRRRGVGRPANEGRERPDVPNVVAARLFGIRVMACPLAEMFSSPAPVVVWRAPSRR
jgi:hypothetical protein